MAKLDQQKEESDSEVRAHLRKWAKVELGEIQVSAYVDGGNAVWEAISEDVYKYLGEPELCRNKDFDEVSTAQQGASMKVLGQVKQPIRLLFENYSEEFSITPLVIQGLSMPFNLSGVFLTKHGLDQKFSRGALAHGRTLIPLYPQPPVKTTSIEVLQEKEAEEIHGLYAVNQPSEYSQQYRVLAVKNPEIGRAHV